MQCPKCGATASESDRFCEECGTSLVVGATTTPTGRCEKCNAGPEQIDAEGFCSSCGFRREARERDRIEFALQPNLAGVTDRGLRHHRNEDYFACAKAGENYVLVVCDGVSSSQDPDKAAKVAAESACKALTAAVQSEVKIEEAIKVAFATALTSIYAIPYTKSVDADPPSTTIVAAVVQNGTATIGCVGDSRAYWISPNGSKQLTKDDSWMSDVVSSGQMTEAEASKSTHAHAITRWLGVDASDTWELSVVNFDIPGSGYLLLCTDGLWNYAPEAQQIAALVQEISDAEAIAVSRSLVEFARSQGGYDNITVAILCL